MPEPWIMLRVTDNQSDTRPPECTAWLRPVRMTLSGYLTSKSVFGQHSVAAYVRLLEPTAQIWMKIGPYYQRQKCRPMNLVSENIRFMRIFAGVPLGAGVKRHWGLSTTAIFVESGGYVFENFTDTASNNMWRYATRCPPANDCKVNDLEWPWAAISWKNAFSASTSWIRVFECQK